MLHQMVNFAKAKSSEINKLCECENEQKQQNKLRKRKEVCLVVLRNLLCMLSRSHFVKWKLCWFKDGDTEKDTPANSFCLQLHRIASTSVLKVVSTKACIF